MVIGVCGYGYTGTGAVYSLLGEYENVYCLSGDKENEFILTYTPDGIEDLEYHLCINPVKASGGDAAIYRFKLMCNDLERSFNRYTNGHFMEYSEQYINELIQVRWKAIRVFEYDRQPGRIRRYRKLITNVLRKQLNTRGVKFDGFPHVERYLSFDPENFLQKSREYVQLIIGNHEKQCVVLNQPFTSSNPSNSMKFFEDPYCIIVDRDPRDLYVMAKHIYGTNGAFIPTDNVKNFINYYRIIRSEKHHDKQDKILKIRFEDLIYKYDDTVKTIEDFMKSELGRHVHKMSKFDPNISKENTCVYSLFPEDRDDIRTIEIELKEWLYDFDNLGIKRENTDLKKFIYL